LNLFKGFSFGINLWLKRDELDEVAIANRKDFFGCGCNDPRHQEKSQLRLFYCSTSTIQPPSSISAMEQQEIRIISQQSGCIVRGHDGSYVTKTGGRVLCAEEGAIKPVKQHTDVPVPDIYSIYRADIDHLGMTIIPGLPRM
jgi:hypothetical protein